MARTLISKYEISVAGNGGKVILMTRDGLSYTSPILPIPMITAIAAIITGPNPSFDHSQIIYYSEDSAQRPSRLLAFESTENNKSNTNEDEHENKAEA